MRQFFLNQVTAGRHYYYQHVGLTGSHGEVYLVKALESRNVGNVTVLVRFENGNEVRVKTDHLHVSKPKSPLELRQDWEAKVRAERARLDQQQAVEHERVLIKQSRERERRQNQKRALREEAKRRHLAAEKRRKEQEKREKARAKRRHLAAEKRRKEQEKREKARAKRLHVKKPSRR